MTYTRPPSGSRQANLDGVIIFGVVICALLGGAFAYWRMEPERDVSADDFAFEPIEVDRRRLDAARADKYAAANLERVEADWQNLVASARAANRAQFQATSGEQFQKLRAEIKVWAEETIVGTGYDAFLVTGQPVFQACQAGLEHLMGAVESGDLSVETATSEPPEDQFSRYRSNCGNLLPVLIERGLVDANGKWTSPNAPIIADLLNRYRWAHIIRDQKEPWSQLTSLGARTFGRWRIEQARGFTLAQRRQFAQTLGAQFDDYDVDYARGILAYRNGRIKAARKHFRRLAADQPRYERYVAFLNSSHPETPDESRPR